MFAPGTEWPLHSLQRALETGHDGRHCRRPTSGNRLSARGTAMNSWLGQARFSRALCEIFRAGGRSARRRRPRYATDWPRAVSSGIARLGTGTAVVLRKRYLSWGATAAEIERVMPGDADVPDPNYATTLGVTIDAPVPPRLAVAAADGLSARRTLQLRLARSSVWVSRSSQCDSRASAVAAPRGWGGEIPIGAGAGFPVRASIRSLTRARRRTGQVFPGSGSSGSIRWAANERGSFPVIVRGWRRRSARGFSWPPSSRRRSS